MHAQWHPLEVPRDRNGEFDPVTLPTGVRRLTDSGDIIMPVIGRGITTLDIANHLKVTYGASVGIVDPCVHMEIPHGWRLPLTPLEHQGA